MAQQARLTATAGIVIVAGVLLLIGFSLQSTGKGWFYKGYELHAKFQSARGIEPGSQVALAGVPIGRVDKIGIDTRDGSVTMALLIDEPNKIPADSVASIRLKTLLGSYIVYIDYGTPGAAPLPPDATLKTEEIKDIQQAFQDLGKLASGSGSPLGGLDKIETSADGLIKKIGDMVDENRANILATTKAFAEAGPKFTAALDDVTSFTHGLRDSRGTLYKLMNDDALYNQAQDIMTKLDTFSRDLNEGDGTIPRLVHDKALADKIEATVDNITTASASIRDLVQRNGPNIDKAIANINDLMPKLNQGMDSFVSIGQKVDKGDGSLAKLINDPQLYNSTLDAVNQIKRAFQEGEEQGVMRTFLGVFFGSVL